MGSCKRFGKNMLETIKKNGMRKMAWGLVALGSIVGLTAFGKLGADGAVFGNCFMFLVGAVMGANYGEHKEKGKKVEPAAPVVAP